MKGMSTATRIPTVGAAASSAAPRKALMVRQQKTGKKVRPLPFFFWFPLYLDCSRLKFSLVGGGDRCGAGRCRCDVSMSNQDALVNHGEFGYPLSST